jgi:hypothetical protein
MDLITNPKVTIMEGKIKAHFLAHNISSVESVLEFQDVD